MKLTKEQEAKLAVLRQYACNACLEINELVEKCVTRDEISHLLNWLQSRVNHYGEATIKDPVRNRKHSTSFYCNFVTRDQLKVLAMHYGVSESAIISMLITKAYQSINPMTGAL